MHIVESIYHWLFSIMGFTLAYHCARFTYNYIECLIRIWKNAYDVPLKSEAEQRFNARLQHFHESFSDEKVDYNENIDPIVYDRKTYDALIQHDDNELEKVWSTRILIEMTSRGNCILRYNLYKHAFEYYADSYIPYAVLNAAAMKYVLMYRCRDFFVDEHCLPATHTSGLTDSIKKYEDAKKKEHTEKNKQKHNGLSGPFLRSKSVNKNKSTDDLKEHKSIDKPVVEDKIINKFSYMGKLVNFSMLVKPKRVNPLNGFNTDLLDNASLSYEEFKKRKLESQK